MKYSKGKKGIMLVWGAFFLILLLMFLGLATDIAYMYVTKNQLQVAADASALAGAKELLPVLDDNTSAFKQMDARQEAWKFACKNSAAGDPVFLVTDDSRPKNNPNCDNPPLSNLNETNNLDTVDIVVGNWDRTRINNPFIRADGTTNLRINAIRVVPTRTGSTPGMPRVGLFIGKVFGWSVLSAKASAIAALKPLSIGPFPTCLPSCDLPTPLKTQWDYDQNQPIEAGVNPILCSDPNLPPGNGNSNTDDSITPSSTPGQVFSSHLQASRTLCQDLA